jgi:hypothetical protein
MLGRRPEILPDENGDSPSEQLIEFAAVQSPFSPVMYHAAIW